MSDITFKYSQIGGGKSFHSVIELCGELEKTDRYLVTNISILLDDAPRGYIALRDWADKWIKSPVSFEKRYAWLTKEQAVEFYRFLPAGDLRAEDVATYGLEIHENVFERNGRVLARCRVAKLPLREDAISGKLVDFAARNRQTGCFKRGCHYWIDEAHKLFSARQYQKVSPMLEDYTSELRKLDDDLTLITQNPEKADKNLRRNATEWLQVENMSKKRLFMGVSLPNRFRYYWYNQTEMPSRLDKPTVSGWYSFDGKRQFHKLYMTMDGVGVSGGMVAESQKFKGLHWSVWILALAAVCVAAYLFPRVIQSAVKNTAGRALNASLTGLQEGAAGAVKPKGSVAPAPSAGPARVESSPVPARVVVPPPYVPPVSLPSVEVKYWSRAGDDMVVYLTDGRVARKSRGEVQSLSENFCVVFNQRMRVQQ